MKNVLGEIKGLLQKQTVQQIGTVTARNRDGGWQVTTTTGVKIIVSGSADLGDTVLIEGAEIKTRLRTTAATVYYIK